MYFVAIVFVAFLAVYTGPSSALTGNVDSLLRKNNTAEELGTCPMNSSISVKVFRSLKGEWLTAFVASNKLGDLTRSIDLNLKKNILECADSRYITISGILKDTEVGNYSEATVGEYWNNTDGEACDSCKRCFESAITADLIFMNETIQENLMEARKSSDRMKTMEDRMTSVENTLTTMNGTLTIVKESHANVENTLKYIEKTVNLLNTMLKGIPGYGSFDALCKGRKVGFSFDLRTAWRTKPTEDAGEYAGVVSNSVLEDDQVFQIRIDEAIEEWSEFGIAIGVIKEKQEGMKDARDILGIKGTWAIHSRTDSKSGKSHTWKDGNRITRNGYPLSTKHLKVGTLLGVSRRRNGNLHFYLDGVDKGAAFFNVPKGVYAFVDVMNYVTKISITN